jgi:ureidoglycolate dehydrogenase (NAD+)
MFESWDRPGQNGHCFIALDVSSLMPLERFHDRMDALAGAIRQARPQRGVDQVLLPGERRWDARDDRIQHGIPLDDKTVDALEGLARDLGIDMIQ